jgi:hypothetical protein
VCASPATGSACAAAIKAKSGGKFIIFNKNDSLMPLPAPPRGQFREFTCTSLGSGMTCLGSPAQGPIASQPKDCAAGPFDGQDGTLLPC